VSPKIENDTRPVLLMEIGPILVDRETRGVRFRLLLMLNRRGPRDRDLRKIQLIAPPRTTTPRAAVLRGRVGVVFRLGREQLDLGLKSSDRRL
jgi:hypothetical protein